MVIAQRYGFVGVVGAAHVPEVSLGCVPLLAPSVLGVKPRTAVRANPGSWEKISDPQDLKIFNQARKKCSRFLFSQEGRLKSHPSFTSLLQNYLFRETVFHFYS
jgi:hypothetical protein